MRHVHRIAGISLLTAITVLLTSSNPRAQAITVNKEVPPMLPLKQVAYIKASNAEAYDHFACGGGNQGHTGTSIALSGDANTMAVGAPFESGGSRGVNGNQNDNSMYAAGAVYVYIRQGQSWMQQAYVKASNPGINDHFGSSVALSRDGNTMVVAAHWEASGATGINGNQADNSKASAGAVYVFTRSGTTWSQQAYVKPSDVDAGDLFGYSVALTADGNTLAVGAFDEDGSARTINGPVDNKANGSGAAYVFTRTGADWSQQAYIKPSNGEAQDSFGVAVALSDDGSTLLVGSLDEDCSATGVNPPGCDNDQKEDVSAGAAYVFVRSGTTWSQQAFLKASNTGYNDWFGSRLALSGDGNVAAIGASLEDSNATGINGNQKDDSANEAGAAYLFVRTGTTWQQQAYIKGSNTEAYDEFGSSLALDRGGRTLVISARGEDGGGRGDGGKPSDNSVDEAGAVYVFHVAR